MSDKLTLEVDAYRVEETVDKNYVSLRELGLYDDVKHIFKLFHRKRKKVERLTAENAALVEAIQGLISADTLEEKTRAQCAALDAALDLINPLPEGGRDFHALEKR